MVGIGYPENGERNFPDWFSRSPGKGKRSPLGIDVSSADGTPPPAELIVVNEEGDEIDVN